MKKNSLKGWKTVLVNVAGAVGVIAGLETTDLATLNEQVKFVAEGAAVVWAAVNVVLRLFTNSPAFKKE